MDRVALAIVTGISVGLCCMIALALVIDTANAFAHYHLPKHWSRRKVVTVMTIGVLVGLAVSYGVGTAVARPK